MQDKRTYRKCVRVIITKGKEILLGKKFIGGKFSCYEFPGGGVENGDDLITTVLKECLEEVGIAVKNIKGLGLEFKYEIDYPDPERAKFYRGGIDIWMTAEFAKKDISKHDSEDDALPYTWETFDKAKKKIIDGPESRYNGPRLEAIEKVIELQSNKKKLSLEDW